MIATLIIFLLTIISMILSIILFPKLKIKDKEIDTYWVVCLTGAILLFIFGKVDFKSYIDSLTNDSSVNPIKIIILFFSMTILSLYLDEFGFFKYVANKALKISGNNQLSIFTVFYITISLLTVFTSNDIVILTFTPFILYFTKHSKIDPIPFLISEFIAANTLSLTFLIGNPTNIYLSLSENITFIEYFKVMGIRSIVLSLFSYLILWFVFRKKLNTEMIKEYDDCKLENKTCVIASLIALIIATLMLVISSYIHVEMYLISLISALSITVFIFIYQLITIKNEKSLLNVIKRLPYSLIPFLFSMFAIVLALNNNGITEKLSNVLNTSNNVLSIGYSSFISCSLMNNIPMSVLFANILSNPVFDLNAVYAAIIGSNIGALFTPVGALAGIMFLNIVNKMGVKMNYLDFTKICMPISVILMTFALLLLLI